MRFTKSTLFVVALSVSAPVAAEEVYRIEIDATSLTETTLRLNGAERFRTDSRTAFSLPSGIYSISYATHDRYSDDVDAAKVVFEVTESGTVDFTPSLDEVLDGRGGQLLYVTGVAIELDLSVFGGGEPTVEIIGIGPFTTETSHSLSLLPGTHQIRTIHGKRAFSVNPDATIDYGSAATDPLSKPGTGALTISGTSDESREDPGRIINLAVASERAHPTDDAARALILELISLGPYDHVDRAAVVERELLRLR